MLKATWSFEDALDAHEWLDALEDAQVEAGDRARRAAEERARRGGAP
jgi:hypothetical protein